MAAVYRVKIKTVSAFCNYSESDIVYIIEKLLKDYRDKKTGLGFEAIEIDVERL